MMKAGRLYMMLLALLAAGYAWVLWNVLSPQYPVINVCLFRRITGLPCPSCGTTRSVLALCHLHFTDALYFNPLGFIVALALCILPIWILYDLASGQRSFFLFYHSAEKLLQQRQIAIPAILLIMANWIWNIYKYRL